MLYIMELFSILTLLTSLFFARADNTKYPTPYHGQIGDLHFPVTCNVFGFINITLDGIYTATAPLIAQAGQEIYYTDVTATLTIPTYISELGSLIGGKSADTLVYVALDLTEAEPSELNVFPNGLWVNDTLLNEFGEITVRVPPEGVIPPLGPITMGDANSIHQIYLGPINATVYVRNATGGLVFGPLDVICPHQDLPILIGIVDIYPDEDGVPEPYSLGNGYVPDYPVLDEFQEFGCFNFDYACDLTASSDGGKVSSVFNTLACGAVFAYEKPNSPYNVSGVTAYLNVPADALSLLKAIDPSASQISTTINSFYITATNSNPAEVNGLTAPYTSDPVPIPSGNYSFILPQNGNFTVGPFTSGNEIGQQMFIGIGNASAVVHVLDGTGNKIDDVAVNCVPPPNLNFIGLLISDTTPTAASS